jgi:hypothetical protein
MPFLEWFRPPVELSHVRVYPINTPERLIISSAELTDRQLAGLRRSASSWGTGLLIVVERGLRVERVE